MNQIVWIIFIFFMGSLKHQQDRSLYPKILRTSKPLFIKDLSTYLMKQQNSEQSKKFSLVLLTGNFDKESKQKKNTLRDLYLLHVFTPSGMHFSLILVPIFWLIRRQIFRLTILLFLGLGLLYLPGLEALKRGWLFIFCLKGLGLKLWPTYILTFSIDLLFWTFADAKFSFGLSFLFYALLILLSNNNILIKILTWGKANLVLTLIFNSHFNFLGFIFGQLLTVLYSMLFPILIYALPFPFILQKTLNILDLLLNLTWWSQQMIIPSSSFYITTEFCLILMFIRPKINFIMIIFIIIMPWNKIADDKTKQCSAPRVYQSTSFSSCQTFPKI